MSDGGISPLPREARAYQGHRAGVVTRVVAATIDSVVVSVALLLLYAGIVAVDFLLDPRDFNPPKVPWLLSAFSWMALLVVYLTVAWAISGRTYGCLVMGLRVVGRGGGRLGLPGSLLRALFYAVLPIGLFWCALNRESRSVQDVVLRTSVIYDWQHREGDAATRPATGGPEA